MKKNKEDKRIRMKTRGQERYEEEDCRVKTTTYINLYRIKGKGKSHIRSVRWGVPVREDTCPEPSAFLR